MARNMIKVSKKLLSQSAFAAVADTSRPHSMANAVTSPQQLSKEVSVTSISAMVSQKI